MQVEDGAGSTAQASLPSAERRARFVRGLYDGGRVPVAVGALATAAPEGVPPVLGAALLEADALGRAAAPGDAPELELVAAAWGLERLHGAGRALVERSLPAGEVETLVSAPFAGARTA